MTCYSCIHLMQPEKTADSLRRCRVAREAEPVSPELEAECERFVREVGSDDAIPEWYRDAWNVKAR